MRTLQVNTSSLSIIAALAILAAPVSMAHGQSANACPAGATTCNIATVGDTDISAPQTIGDHVNPTYSPDSASASASTGAIDVDNIVQGDTLTQNSYGNVSTNNNQSSANNNANVTGGNITSNNSVTQDASVDGGNISSTQQALTYGGSASTTSGQATTNSGSVNASGGQGGKGGSSSSYSGDSTSSASGGSSNSGGNVLRGGDHSTVVDASQRTTVKHAAAMASPVAAPGYGPGNCFGDTNPSGSFGASIQTFGWGVSASSQKASNVCAMAQIAGPRAAAAYLAEMDPNARRAMLNNGIAITKEEAKRRSEVSVSTTTVVSKKKLACPAGYGLVDLGYKMTCRPVVATPASASPVTCPAGSSWDGRGCWVPGVRRAK